MKFLYLILSPSGTISTTYFFSLSLTDKLDKKDLHDLFQELNLLGTLESRGPGDEPLICYHKQLLYLGADGGVKLGSPA